MKIPSIFNYKGICRRRSGNTEMIGPKLGGKRAVALLMTAVLITGLVVPALADGGSSTKQEVVYINLKSDGTVEGIYVVNIFDIDGEGRIIDHGDYTALRNMTTDDKIQFDSQTVKIDTNAKKLYYEGKLNSNAMPWLFDIHYYIDGQEYSADELAGKSGSLKITISVLQNIECDSAFFDHYALSASLSFDTNNCSNIVADGATEANVGKNRQLSYIIMPGIEKDIVITADVKDFQMDGIAINGLSMSLDFDIDLENNANINELQDGVAKLDDGAHDLNVAVGKLSDGAFELVDGAKDLKDGTSELYDGATELKDGADTLHDGVQALNEGTSDLLDGADDLADGSEDLYDGASGINDGAQALYDGAKELGTGTEQLADGARQLKKGADGVADGAAGLNTGLNTLAAQNSSVQTMSEKLYNSALAQYSALLTGGGYTVTVSSTTNELRAMLAQRQSELTGDSEKAGATQTAITARIAELSEITADAEGSHTPEEIAAAQNSLKYWNMTSVLQGMQKYEVSLSAAIAAEGDDPEAQAMAQAECDAVFAAALNSYQSLLTPYLAESGGDVDAAKAQLMADYSALTTQVGAAEQAVITQMVTEALGGAVAGDDVYIALAVLSYYKGIIDYTNGVATAATGAAALSLGASKLYSGARDLYDGAKDLEDGSEDLVDSLSKLKDGTAELKDGTLELQDGVLTLRDGVVTLNDGTQDLLDGVLDLQDGTLRLCDGIVDLRSGTVQLLDGAVELHNGTVKLHDGTAELVDGTIELRDKTSDESLKEKLKDAINEILGADFDPVSFVSCQNTNVDSVQFVIKTPDIHIEETDYVPETVSAPMNLWQKFLNLFGLYHGE